MSLNVNELLILRFVWKKSLGLQENLPKYDRVITKSYQKFVKQVTQIAHLMQNTFKRINLMPEIDKM